MPWSWYHHYHNLHTFGYNPYNYRYIQHISRQCSGACTGSPAAHTSLKTFLSVLLDLCSPTNARAKPGTMPWFVYRPRKCIGFCLQIIIHVFWVSRNLFENPYPYKHCWVFVVHTYFTYLLRSPAPKNVASLKPIIFLIFNALRYWTGMPIFVYYL